MHRAGPETGGSLRGIKPGRAAYRPQRTKPLGRVVVVVGASGSRSNRQAGSECVEHEPALPRVRGAQLATPALAGGGIRCQWPRLPSQQQQPGTQGMRGLQRQDSGKVPPARPR